MSKNETKLTTKVSSLISGQSPDFVQSDHPLFIKFLKDYYQFLEAGRLTITATIQHVVQETVATNYKKMEENLAEVHLVSLSTEKQLQVERPMRLQLFS